MRFRTILDLTLKNLEHGYYKLTGQRSRIVPYKILVELTTQCNSKCLYCDIWKIKKEDLQKIDLQDLEDFLKKMGTHLLWLAMTGGEITTNNQFPEIIKLIRQNCPKLRIITFTTNGLQPERILEYALLIKNQLDSDTFITISLDGDEETHDTIRGVKGNYEKCMETYRLLHEHGIPCHFGLTVSQGNFSFIQRSFTQYRDKIKAVTFFHSGGIFLNEKAVSNKESDLKMAESLKEIYRQYRIESLGEILVKIFLKASIVFLQQDRKTNIIPCDVGSSSAHLMANGDLTPCMYLPALKKIGPSFEITDFHSPLANSMMADIRKNKCPHCWMNCYAPHSILQSPAKSLAILLKPL